MSASVAMANNKKSVIFINKESYVGVHNEEAIDLNFGLSI